MWFWNFVGFFRKGCVVMLCVCWCLCVCWEGWGMGFIWFFIWGIWIDLFMVWIVGVMFVVSEMGG